MEQTSNDVPQDPSPAVSEDNNTHMQPPGSPATDPEPATPPVGSQTPPENLYAALAEERRLRQEAENKLKNIAADPSEPVYISDEGKQLKSEVDSLKDELVQIKEDKALDALSIQYPVLKENIDKFKEFRKNEHPRAKIESVVKLFLAEKGLLEPQRVGLENPTGGDRTPVDTGMTPDDIANLRKTNWKKYQELLSKGAIQMAE